MRDDPIQFAQANEAPNKRPRYVISILFDTASIYCTSHADISSVPGVVLAGVLKDPSAISQRLFPDDGRSEIGSFNFSLVDLESVFTDAIRDKLNDGAGMRGRTVQFWCGFEGFDFTAFELFQTQIVVDCSYEEGVYEINCADLTRAQRKDIFEPKFTNLQSNLSASDTTILVYDTDDFALVVHGTSWGDAPSSTVGYLRIEDEKIRYTGKTASSFTGCTRGVLNTKAVAHEVDAGTAQERRTKVYEEIYLELPAVKMAWAVMTGELYGSANTLPAHWHVGIDPVYLREIDFSNIGSDLWDTADDAAAIVARFEGLTKTDGKRFLEQQLFLMLGCYSPVYSDGTLGLRRLPALLDDSAAVMTLTARELISVTMLQHDMAGMHNNVRVNWNFDHRKDEYTRITTVLDVESIAINGTADLKEYSFKGLYGSRHTDAIVRQRVHSLRDAYAYPPQRITATVPGSLSRIELGDVVRLNVANVRDFAGAGANINRAFVVLNKSHRASSNEVTLELFGSTARPVATTPGTGEVAPLPDAFYIATGTNLNTIATITANTMATGSYVINGNASLTNAGAVYYHNNDLTIPNGCDLTITGNVQLRIRGFLTVNGTINGTGGGKAGVADAGTGPWDLQMPGTAGYVGITRGYDGIHVTGGGPPTGMLGGQTLPVHTTKGVNDVAPFRTYVVSGSNLQGLPDDLRGGGGGPGGRIVYTTGIQANGGTGGAGGAGLAIICRGMTCGVSAEIVLNGANTTSPATVAFGVGVFYPGAGAPGGPGSLLILLDGNELEFPDIKFEALVGTLTQSGNAMRERRQTLPASRLSDPEQGNPWCGYLDAGVQSGTDHSNAAHRIQYIPETQTPANDAVSKPAAPTALSTRSRAEFITVNADAAIRFEANDQLQIWASLDNNRANALRVAQGKFYSFNHELPVLTTRYYWTRILRDFTDLPDVYSEWYPSGATSGVSGSTLNPNGWSPVSTAASGATMLVSANRIEKSGGITAWDSQVYSIESYTSCAITFRAAQTNQPLMIGFNVDPTTDADFTSIDYCWYPADNGNAYIYESGSTVLNTSTYDTSTSFTLTYDGSFVRYYKNGTLMHQTPRFEARFYLDSSWHGPSAAAVGVEFGPITVATPWAYTARGNCRVSDSNVIKQGGSAAWDSDCFSMHGYLSCFVAFKANQTNGAIMVGLSQTPAASESYTTLDYAWYMRTDGTLVIYEDGSDIGGYGAYTTSTILAITYDGSTVTYWKNNVSQRTVSVSGLTLYMDSSFNTVGHGINSMRFGPTDNRPLASTGEIEPGAVVAEYTVFDAGPIGFSNIS